MAVDAGTAVVEVRPDLDNFGRTLGSDINRSFSGISGTLKNIGKGIALGIGAGLVGAGVFAKSAIDAASDLNETISKSNTIFGSAGKSIENWANGAAKAFGQSKQGALDAAATFGNLFVQLGIGSSAAAGMSTKMVELASDFASFHNANPSEVIDAMTAAFRGEYDAVQRFVPTISAATVEQRALADSHKETTKELTAQEKAIAVQELLYEGAGAALGDFSRTSSGAANQQRILKAQMADLTAQIGTRLLPIYTKLLGVVVDKVLPGLKAFGSVIMDIGKLIVGSFTGKGANVERFGKTWTNAFIEIGAAVRRVSDIVGDFVKNAVKQLPNLWKAFKQGDGVGEVLDNIFGNTGKLIKIFDRLVDVGKSVVRQFTGGGGAGGSVKSSFDLVGPAVSVVGAVLLKLADGITKLLDGPLKRFVPLIVDLTLAFVLLHGPVSKAIDIIGSGVSKVVDFGKAVAAIPGKVKDAADAVAGFARAVASLVSKTVDIGVNVAQDAFLRFLYLRDAIKGLASKTVSIAVDLKDEAIAAVNRLRTAIDGLVDRFVHIGVDVPSDATIDAAGKRIGERLGSSTGASLKDRLLQAIPAAFAGFAGGGGATSVLANPVGAAIGGAIATAIVAFLGFKYVVAPAVKNLSKLFRDHAGPVARALLDPEKWGQAAGLAAGAVVIAFVGLPLRFAQLAIESANKFGTSIGETLKAKASDLLSVGGDVGRSVGTGVLGELGKLPGQIGGIASRIPGFFAALPGQVVAILAPLPGQIVSFFAGLPAMVGGIVSQIPGFFASLPGAIFGFIAGIPDLVGGLFGLLPGVVQRAIAAIPGIVAGIMRDIADGFRQGWDQVNRFTSGALNNIVGAIGRGMATAADVVWRGIGSIVSFFAGLPGRVLGAIGDLAGMLGRVGSSALGAMAGAVSAGINGVVDFFLNLPGRITRAIGDLGSLLIDAGAAVVRGLIRGIESLSPAGAIRALADKIPGPFKKLLGIGSPSKVFQRFGENIGEGLVLGLRAQRPAVASAVAGMTAGLSLGDLSVGVSPRLSPVPSVIPAAPSAAVLNSMAAAGGSSTSNNINIYVDGAGDPEATAEAVYQKLNRKMRVHG